MIKFFRHFISVSSSVPKERIENWLHSRTSRYNSGFPESLEVTKYRSND
ncbi:MAG: hypothetical protein HKN00_13290 [Flavobacteriaceae bacterium]|nr:hypothetical protein [Flavobacteriaceae bacterium]